MDNGKMVDVEDLITAIFKQIHVDYWEERKTFRCMLCGLKFHRFGEPESIKCSSRNGCEGRYEKDSSGEVDLVGKGYPYRAPINQYVKTEIFKDLCSVMGISNDYFVRLLKDSGPEKRRFLEY